MKLYIYDGCCLSYQWSNNDLVFSSNMTSRHTKVRAISYNTMMSSLSLVLFIIVHKDLKMKWGFCFHDVHYTIYVFSSQHILILNWRTMSIFTIFVPTWYRKHWRRQSGGDWVSRSGCRIAGLATLPVLPPWHLQSTASVPATLPRNLANSIF